jgi:hypothetical protein
LLDGFEQPVADRLLDPSAGRDKGREAMDNVRKFAKVVGIVAAAMTALGIVVNFNEIVRYVRISRM